MVPFSSSGKGITGDEIDLGHNRVRKSDIDKPDPNKDVTTLQEVLADIDEAINLGKSTVGRRENDKHGEENNDCIGIVEETNTTNLKCDSKHNDYVADIDKVENVSDGTDFRETKEGRKVAVSVTDEIDNDVDVQDENSPHVESGANNSEQNSRLKCEAKNNLVKEIVEVQPPVKLAKLEINECIKNNRNENTPNQHSSQFTKTIKPTSAKRKDEENLNKVRDKILTLESNLKQWMSVDTLIVLLGESVVQTALLETNKQYKQHTVLMKQLETTAESHMGDILGKHVSIYSLLLLVVVVAADTKFSKNNLI